MLGNAKARATRAGVPFEISAPDIIIPSHCPVLGVELYRTLGRKGGGPNSPSLDRIKPELGYVPGNIIVISNRANRIKSDAAPHELRAVADFYEDSLRTYQPREGLPPRTKGNPA